MTYPEGGFPLAQVDGSLSGLDEAAIIGADDADAETNGRTNEWWHLDDSNMTRLFNGYLEVQRYVHEFESSMNLYENGWRRGLQAS